MDKIDIIAQILHSNDDEYLILVQGKDGLLICTPQSCVEICFIINLKMIELLKIITKFKFSVLKH